MFRKVFVKGSSNSSWPPVALRLLLVASAMLMVGQTVGCAGGGWPKLYQDTVIKYRDMVWARRAYNLRYGDCQRDYSQHFENGFEAGYSSTCSGGDGYVPALPPQEYRGYEYQSTDGARCVNSWFEGYPAGVAAARNDKAGTYHDVLISRMIDSAIKQGNTDVALPKDSSAVAATESTGQQSPIPPGASGTFDSGQPPILPPVSSGSMQRDGMSPQPQSTVVPTSYSVPPPFDAFNPESVSWGGWNSPF